MSDLYCYHCGLPVPKQAHFPALINGQTHPMCCAGCQAVAETIVAAGLQDFYTYRTHTAPTAQEIVPAFLQQIKIYDNPILQKQFVHQENEFIREATLILEGITCAACVWLNERHLRTLNGVLQVQINYSTHRAKVRWDSRLLQLSDILQAISQIGYLAHPYDPTQQQIILERERKQQLRRIGVAGALGMQIMMFSIALYAGSWHGMEAEFKQLFHWLNLGLTLPILIYSAQPFFKHAWRDLQHRQAGMDVPVALGLTLAFISSLITTLTAQGEHVYYDSIAMFVFFLLTARYFELMARQKSVRATEELIRLVPTTATRLTGTVDSETEEVVLVIDLAVQDRILIRPGEAIPIDGIVLHGQSTVNESLLTGESYPVPKMSGETVIAGSINIESPLQIQVEKIGEETTLSHILRLLERAQSEKPALTQLADRLASGFVFGVLLLASAVAAYWWQLGEANWLGITLSVLIITCPCALSLATPTAITAATSHLTQSGILITRGHALETLAKATHFVFDKTGTLTAGKLQVSAIHLLNNQQDMKQVLQIAIALERHSEHPIAQALLNTLPTKERILNAIEVINHPGAGLTGQVLGTPYFIGTPLFIQQHTGHILQVAHAETLYAPGHTLILLANSEGLQAAFLLTDQLRDGAQSLIQFLKQQGKSVLLLSGDHASAVQTVAATLGITEMGHSMSPADKLQFVKSLQNQGAIVAMIGDGINDAPVLASAQISIAMGSGTQVAKASADMILLSEQLSQLQLAVHTAQKTLSIIRQNLIWAIGYNLLALPAAAVGWIAPWLAALGMSTSSLVVVLNALRLLKSK